MNRVWLAALVTGLVIVTSGCTDGTTSEDGETPLQVNSFDAVPNPVPGGNQMSLRLELENSGDHDLENVYGTVFGPTFATSEGQTNAWRTAEGGRVSQEYRTLEFGNISRSDDNTPSVPSRSSVTFTAPELDPTRVVPSNFNAMMRYRTRTTGDVNITVMSAERYREVEATQSTPEVDHSSGPIDVTVQGTTPHIFSETGSASSEICFTVTNTGPGAPFLVTKDGASHSSTGWNVEDQDENKVELRVENVGNIQFESQDGGGTTETVELIGNQGYQCFDMNLVGLGQYQGLEQTAQIPVEIIYGYQEETSTSVTVEGKRDGYSS